MSHGVSFRFSRKIGFSARNWVDSAQDRDDFRGFVNAALNLRVSYVMKLVR